MDTEEQERIVKIALRYAVSKSPGFAAIALWCPCVVTTEETVAYTDGRSLFFGQHYFAYPPLEQAAILVHEVLHVALHHIPRVQKAGFDALLWNLCTDALINETIAKMPWLAVPHNAVRLETLLTPAEIADRPAYHWTSETLYKHLLAFPERLEKLLETFAPDLRPANGTGEPLEEQIWGERLKRAAAGDRPGGLMRGLSHDFPTQTIAWEKILRRLMAEPLLPQTKPNWNRPSRRTLCQETAFFEPGTRPQDGLRQAGVVIDTSGSIDQKLLTRFAQEIQGIQRRTGCEVYLVSADAAVQTAQRVRNDGISLQQKILAGSVRLKGGGGTDFYPALQHMKQQKVKVVVYLTDLYGDFGPETRYPFPIIWATTTAAEKAPFGTTLYLEEQYYRAT